MAAFVAERSDRPQACASRNGRGQAFICRKKTRPYSSDALARRSDRLIFPGPETFAGRCVQGVSRRSNRRLLLSRIMTDAKPASRCDRLFREILITDGSLLDGRYQSTAGPIISPSTCQPKMHGDVRRGQRGVHSGDRVLANGMGAERAQPVRHLGAEPSARVNGRDDDGDQRYRLAGRTRSRPPIRSRRRAISPPATSKSSTALTRTASASLSATLTPFVDMFIGHAAVRLLHAGKGGHTGGREQAVPENKSADGLIDFDKVRSRDPANPGHINPVYDCWRSPCIRTTPAIRRWQRRWSIGVLLGNTK